MKVIVGSDVGGFDLKEAIKDMLTKEGHDVTDVSVEPLGYPDAAKAVALGIQNKSAERGILCCGTGAGVSIVANKFKGVYAAAVESEFTARTCREINDCNVMCMGGAVVGVMAALDMVKAFIKTEHLTGFVKNLGIEEPVKAQFIDVTNIEKENFK